MEGNEKPLNATQQILAFVLANPMCSGREVADRMGLTDTFVGEALHRLARQGKLVREQHNGVPPYYWRGPLDTDEADAVPVRRRAVSTWKPHHHRDPFVAAIHGPAPVQA